VITSLLISLFVSLTVTPTISYLFLKKTDPSRPKKRLFGRKRTNGPTMEERYHRIYAVAFRHRKAVLLLSGVFLVCCALTIPQLDFQMVPKANKDVVQISVEGYSMDSLNKTDEIVRQIQQILAAQPETEYVFSGVGLGIPRYDFSVTPKGQQDNIGDILCRVNLKAGGRFKKTSEMVDYLQSELRSRVSDAEISVDELGIFASTDTPVQVKVFGTDPNNLNDTVAKIQEIIREEGGTKISGSQKLAMYNYYVNMDENKLNSIGLTKAEMQNELSIALMGRDVSIYRNGSKEYNINLESDIKTQDQLENYRIKAASSGSKYAVKQFATVELDPEMRFITRIDGQNGVIIGAYPATGGSSIMIQSAVEKRIAALNLPEGITVSYGGDKSGFSDMLSDIALAGIIALVVIFLILYIKFGNMRNVFLVFTSLPFGMLGGISGLFITRQALSTTGMLGLVSLLGCILSTAIVLIDYINTRRAEGVPLQEACRAAGARRLRPILMSVTTTVFGVVPLILSGNQFFIPMAILIMFGLMVSMVFTLILIPMVYYMVESRRERRKK
jgi:multidrug efflux pump subunit AcrB